MRYSTMKYFLCRLGLLLLLAGIIAPAGSCLAQEQGNRGVILPEHYPDRFSGHGCINRIDDNQVVIDDRIYTFTPDASAAQGVCPTARILRPRRVLYKA